jgi:hypothetical protein
LDYVVAMAADGVKDGIDCVETLIMFIQDVFQSLCSGDAGPDRQRRLARNVRKTWAVDGAYSGWDCLGKVLAIAEMAAFESESVFGMYSKPHFIRCYSQFVVGP